MVQDRQRTYDAEVRRGPTGRRSAGSGRRPLRSALVVLISATTLVACSDDPEPDEAAAALARGLSSLDLSSVPFTSVAPSEAGEQLQAAVEGLGGLRPVVSVRSTEPGEGGETATATLDVAWDVDAVTADVATPEASATTAAGEPDWTYTTATELTLVDGRWTVAWSPAVIEPSLASGERLLLRETAAERGDILGADGAVLVTDRPVVRVGIDKTLIPAADLTAAADALAELLDLDRAAYAERVATAGERAFVEAIVLRAEGTSELAEVSAAAIPGVVQLEDEIPLAPTREFARPILGTVGQATAELIEESDGRLDVGDVTGLSGLQRSQDDRLRGTPGVTVVAVPGEGAAAAAGDTAEGDTAEGDTAEGDTGDGAAAGEEAAVEPEPPAAGAERELFTRDPRAGEPLATTLDLDLQSAAEAVLAPVGPPSAIVAIRPSTGDVLAAASGPGSEGYSTATLGQYPPGSTFKVVTTLGLLRTGLTPDSPVECPPTITVDGREFSNYGDYPAAAVGEISLRDAIAYSCNTAMISQREQVPQNALTEAAAALGLGVERDLGVPSFPGAVPAEAGETEHAASVIGQGQGQASPLAMATVAASIAAGETVTPRLLAEGAGGAPAESGLEAEHAAQLRELMRAVVTDGSASFLSDVPGEVAAKTGTAEYGSEQPPRTHAWMIAIRGDLAVAVFVEDGTSGSATAGPLLEEFLRTAG